MRFFAQGIQVFSAVPLRQLIVLYPVYTIQPVVKPVVQPVWQQGLTDHAISIIFFRLTHSSWQLGRGHSYKFLSKGCYKILVNIVFTALQTFPGQSLSRTDVSRTRRFPEWRFPYKTFPGQVILRNFHVHSVCKYQLYRPSHTICMWVYGASTDVSL